jgi:hypothetical protein
MANLTFFISKNGGKRKKITYLFSFSEGKKKNKFAKIHPKKSKHCVN